MKSDAGSDRDFVFRLQVAYKGDIRCNLLLLACFPP